MNLLYLTDNHSTASTPVCRLDNYMETQIRKYQFIQSMMDKYNAPLLNGGDTVDKDIYKSPVEVITTFNLLQEHFPDSIGICGNHDVPYRSYDYLGRSILSMLIASGKFTHITEPYNFPNTNVWIHPFNWGSKVAHIDKKDGSFNVALWHEYVGQKKSSVIGGAYSKEVVEEFHNDFNYILCGDNHQYFIEKYKKCTLINGGSIMRKTSTQINDQPYLHLINTDTGEYTPIKIPIEDNVISREHLEIQEDRDERFESFVTSANNEYEISESFVKNVENYINENKVKEGEIIINKNVEKFVNMSLEGNDAM